ncbi:MAG: histidine kinase [Marinifilaceae bacterium]
MKFNRLKGVLFLIMLIAQILIGVVTGRASVFTRNLGMNDGLPSNTIISIFKDSRGILWLGTDSGLVRYDGVEFQGFPLQDGIAGEIINAIAEDQNGDLWIASQGNGVLRYDGEAFELIDLQIFGLDNSIQFLQFFREFNCLVIGASNGFAVYGSTGLTSFSPLKGNFPLGIGMANAVLKGRTIELRTKEGFCYRYDPFSSELKEIGGDSLGAVEQSVNVVNAPLLRNSNVETTHGKIVDCTKDSNELFWMIISSGEQSKGQLFVYDGKRFVCKHKEFTLSLYDLECLYYDKEENILWIGTQNNGLIQIPKSPFTYFEARDLGSRGCEIVDLYGGENERVYIAFSEGIVVLDATGERKVINRNQFQKACMKSGWFDVNNSVQIFSLGKDSFDKIWIASNVGFFSMDKKSLKLEFKGIQPAEKFLFDNRNQLICKWKNKLNVYSGLEYEKFISNYNFGERNSISFSKVTFRGEDVWIASRGNGLIRLSKDSIQVFNRQNSGIHNVINDIAFDFKGNLLAGGNNGVLYRLSFDGNDLKLMQTLDQKNGLKGTSIHGFQLEGTRYLWLGTNLGLHRIDLKSCYRDTLPEIKFWDEKEGYIDRAGKNSTIDGQGNIWVQTPSRLLRLNTDFTISGEAKSQQVRLKEIKVNNRGLELKDEARDPWTGIPSKLMVLDYDQNSLSFRFNIVNYLNPEKNLFRYSLDGFDKEWSNWSSDGRAIYSNLPYGKYTLRVQGRNLNKGNAQSLAFDFTVLPPWWATWWFSILIFSVVLGILGGGFYAWGCFVKKREKSRNKLFKRIVRLKIRALQAQLDPHFTFNALNSIQSYILEENTEAAMDYLADFSRILRKNFDNATREYIPFEEELSYLKSYINLEKLRFPDKFDFQMDVDENINTNDVKLPPMLIQPFLENSIKYGLSGKSGLGKLKVAFVLDSTNYLHCFIEDDGIGRSKAKNIENGRQINSSGRSVQLTWDRIKLLNHALKDERRFLVEVTDLYDHTNQPLGTRVKIGVPLKN